jgi:hypothetical protein
VSPQRQPVAVLLAEAEVLVKHTHDLGLADRLVRTLLAEEYLEADERTPERIAAIFPGRKIVGWFRIVPCLPNSFGAGEGWAWQLHRASGPCRGAFPGVEYVP